MIASLIINVIDITMKSIEHLQNWIILYKP